MLNDLITRYPMLSENVDSIKKVCELLIKSFKDGNKLLICGNGGSCADCEHIVGELMKGFLSLRRLNDEQKEAMKKNNPNISEEYLDKLQQALPAISLPSFTALNSAFCNDVEPKLMYAQAVMGLGRKNDVLLAISTSGNSENVVAAVHTAKALGVKTIALTGKLGGKLKEISDICISVPETETFKVQELHLPIYHYICAEIEVELF